MNDFDLAPVPDSMAGEFESLSAIESLMKKVDRKKRIEEKNRYIRRYLPELKQGGKTVLDIGTGTGEFLEFARKAGNVAVGIEKWHDLKCRWNEYTRWSMIQWARAGLDVRRYDFAELLMKEKSEFDGEKYGIINSQHAVNFFFPGVFAFGRASGICSNDGEWIIDDRFDEWFSRFFSWCADHLTENGILLVASLRSKNASHFTVRIQKLAGAAGLLMIGDWSNLVHKWRKL